jgi:hypothetical protein
MLRARLDDDRLLVEVVEEGLGASSCWASAIASATRPADIATP